MSQIRRLHHLFVYGTLKHGQPNHRFLSDPANGAANLLGQAWTIDRWPLVIDTLHYLPFLLAAKGNGKRIFGELYEIDDAMLTFMDEFEEHPDWYHRTKIDVVVTKDKPSPLDDDFETSINDIADAQQVWCYILPKYTERQLRKKTWNMYDAHCGLYPTYDVSELTGPSNKDSIEETW